MEDGNDIMASSKKLNGDGGPGEERNEKAAITPSTITPSNTTPSTTTPAPVTDNTALDAVRTKVLGTTELLEAIIVCPPARNIFVIQRVSKTFRAVIASIRIQRKLFFKTCVPLEEWTQIKRVVSGHGPWPDDHPFQWTYIPAHLPTSHTITEDRQCIPAALCPLLYTYRSQLLDEYSESFDEWSYHNGQRKGNEAIAGNIFDLDPACGSWHQMHITDPPCTFVTVRFAEASFRTHSARTLNAHHVEAENESGVKLGGLFDAFCKRRDYSSARSLLRTEPGQGKDVRTNELLMRARSENATAPPVEFFEPWQIIPYIRESNQRLLIPTAEEWAAVRCKGAPT